MLSALQINGYAWEFKLIPLLSTSYHPNTMAEEQPSLIEYPCDFPIKIMGKSQADFTQNVLEIVKHHAPDFDDATMETKISKNGTYTSITCTINATSRSQLDALYQALSDNPLISMTL